MQSFSDDEGSRSRLIWLPVEILFSLVLILGISTNLSFYPLKK